MAFCRFATPLPNENHEARAKRAALPFLMHLNLLPLAALLLISPVIAGSTAQPPEKSPPKAWCHLTTEMASAVTQGWGETRTDSAIGGGPITIAGQRHAKGLGTHSPGEMVFPLGGKHTQFQASVGVDDAGDDRGSVVFQVLLDGKAAFDSGVMKRGQSALPVVLDVTGVNELRLVVTDAGDGSGGDHADWADARLDDLILPGPLPQYSTAGFFAVSDGPRTVANFNPGWRFLKGEAPGAEQPGFDDSAWEAANLPHGLEILQNASGGRNYRGPAWYRKKFDAAADGGKVILYFESVMGKSTVWVNGKKLAVHFGGYLPFAVDATAALNAGGRNNIVAVWADNSDDPTYPPGKKQDSLDFAYLGGIYRDTFLIRTADAHVTLPEMSKSVAGGGVFVGVKDVNGNDAELEVRTEVANEGKSPKTLAVRTILETADGKELLRDENKVEVPPGEARQLAQSLSPKGVHLWHPEDPYLHFIRTEILDGNKVVDSLKTRFGIRLFEMRGKDGLFVNKKFIGHKLNGVNRHQDYALVGNALPNSGQRRDVKLLRESGSTMIRAAHYPMDPAFYDACDEFGMLTTTANPGWQFFNFEDPIFEQRLFEDSRNLVRRDRNHPSMLLWETALNETTDQPDSALKGMNRAANEEYPFPGFYTVADVDEAKRGGLNFYYHGGFDTAVNSQTREFGDGGEVENFFSQNASTRVKREWGEGPLLGQSVILARNLDGVYGTPPQRIGATLWCGIDHERGYHPDPFMGGLLDGFRVPRYSFHLFKSQYPPDYKLEGIATGPMVHIAHELTQVSGAEVIIYSNCEEVRLTWLGSDLGTRKPDEGYQYLPRPPFTLANAFDFGVIKRDWRDRTGKIEMIAEGLIGGKVVARQVKKYPERTTAVTVTVDDAGIGLAADGSDFVPLRATIVDNKGVPKVLASEYVTFEVEGPGEIISGPLAHANPAKTEFGTATALLRAGTRPGVIKVRATVSGLAPGEVYIASAAPVLPLAWDSAYAEPSWRVSSAAAASPSGASSSSGGDDAKLREELRRLQAELTAKEQEMMEMRSTRENRRK
jgi:beta-galactosidase